MLSSRRICSGCRAKLSLRRTFAAPNSTQQLSRRANITTSAFQLPPQSINPLNTFNTSFLRKPTGLRSQHGAIPQIRSLSGTHALRSEIPPQTGVNPEPLLPDIGEIAQNATRLVDKSQPWEMGMFLKTYGFNFGWGTSTMMQDLLEFIHVHTGTEWWSSILITGIIVRAIMFPLVANASNESAKLRAISSVMKPIQEKQRAAMLAGDRLAGHRAQQELSKIRQDVGISYIRMFLPMLQLPLGFGIFRQLRNMAYSDVPGLSSEGILWFQNLIVPDPYFVIPVVTGLVQYATMKTSFRLNARTTTAQLAGFQNVLIYVLPGVSVLFLSWTPACIGFNFMCTAIMAFGTNLILQTPVTRRMLNMVPMVSPSSSSSASAYQGTINVSARVKSHPDNIKAEKHRKASEKKFTDNLKPSNFKRLITNGLDGITDTITGLKPEAKEAQKKQLSKAEKRSADTYERKRRREIDQERSDYEQRNHRS